MDDDACWTGGGGGGCWRANGQAAGVRACRGARRRRQHHLVVGQNFLRQVAAGRRRTQRQPASQDVDVHVAPAGRPTTAAAQKTVTFDVRRERVAAATAAADGTDGSPDVLLVAESERLLVGADERGRGVVFREKAVFHLADNARRSLSPDASVSIALRPSVNIVETTDVAGSVGPDDESTDSSVRGKRSGLKHSFAVAKGTASGWLSALSSMLQPAGSHLAVGNTIIDDVSATDMSLHSNNSVPWAESSKLLSGWRKFSSKNDRWCFVLATSGQPLATGAVLHYQRRPADHKSGQRAGRTRHLSSSSSDQPGIRPFEWRDDADEVSYAALLLPYDPRARSRSPAGTGAPPPAVAAQRVPVGQQPTVVPTPKRPVRQRNVSTPSPAPIGASHLRLSSGSQSVVVVSTSTTTQQVSVVSAGGTTDGQIERTTTTTVGRVLSDAGSCGVCAAIEEHVVPADAAVTPLHVCVHQTEAAAPPSGVPPPTSVAADSPSTRRLVRRGGSEAPASGREPAVDMAAAHSSPAVSSTANSPPPKASVHGGHFNYPPTTSFEQQPVAACKTPFAYSASILNNEDFGPSAHKTALRFTGYVISIIEYVDKEQLKKETNEQFRQRFPYIQLTYSKFKSIKRDMCAIANEVGLDAVTLAHAYVYFEKCVLKGAVNKYNRKLVAGACLLLAGKLMDVRGAQLTALVDAVESTMRESKKELLQHELPVAVALDFDLMLPDDEVRPHWIMLRESML